MANNNELREEIKNDLESLFIPRTWTIDEMNSDGMLCYYTCSPSEYIVQIFLDYNNQKIYFTFGKEDYVDDFCDGGYNAVTDAADYDRNSDAVIHSLKGAVDDYDFEDEE